MLRLHGQGRHLIADELSHVIRRLESDGTLTTLSGLPFFAGLNNGLVASFKNPLAALQPGVNGAINSPLGIAVLPSGRVVVTSEQAFVGD
jgi:hypothetical protein